MKPAQKKSGTFVLHHCLWQALNEAFDGDTSKEIKNVRCYESEDGSQDMYINYACGLSKRVDNISIFSNAIIEDNPEFGIEFGFIELYILHYDKLYRFCYDINEC